VNSVVHFAMLESGGAYDQSAIGDGIGHGTEFLGIRQNFRGRTERRTGLSECQREGIHDAQVENAKVAHGPCGRP